ncbi:MAG: DNA polymerase III subunit beta [bacterium]|nr:DNA polymerase III subunit beta [bacterium]
MRLTTTKEKILSAAVIAERIVGKKESLPILSCILLDVGGVVSVRSTNLEAGVDIGVVAEIEERGMIAVPALIFSQTIRSISADKVVLKTDSENLIVESRGTRTLIKSVPHEEFPKLSWGDDGKKSTSIGRLSIIKGIQSVLYSASHSMIRPELGSVYVSIKKDGVTFAATDSFRLAERVIKGGVSSGEGEFLIPLKHAAELVYVLERNSCENVKINTSDSQLVVLMEHVRFVARVVDGIFPNYTEIIPKQFSTEATILKNDFAEMLRKARVFSGNDQYVGLHVYPKKKIFSATAQSPDVGETSDSIDAAVSGEDIDINFHIGYLSDFIAAIDSDSITLGFSGPNRPLVIRGAADPGFTYLVMPLNR